MRNSTFPTVVKKGPGDRIFQHKFVANKRQNLKGFQFNGFIFTPPFVMTEGYVMELNKNWMKF